MSVTQPALLPQNKGMGSSTKELKDGWDGSALYTLSLVYEGHQGTGVATPMGTAKENSGIGVQGAHTPCVMDICNTFQRTTVTKSE